MSRRPINLLTPISSPMVTRPTSPTASGRLHTPLVPGDPQPFPADPTASPAAAAAAESAVADLWCSAAAAPQQVAASVASFHPLPAVEAGRWRSPPCCSGCGAAKANAGRCIGCGSHFCKACSPLGGSCVNCSSLCLSCKPVACSFCEQREHGPNRLCEACAGTCDACQKTACSQCAATFSSCSSCGYATCEECQLQLQLGGMHGGTSSAAGSCWCAPPIRSAANVRHISTQRYQMEQIHPCFRASSMEAAGLRDADDDDYAAYDEYAESATEELGVDSSSSYSKELQRYPQQLRPHVRAANTTAAAEAAMLVSAGPGGSGRALSGLSTVKIPPVWPGSPGVGSPSSSYSSSGQVLVGSFTGAASTVGGAGAGGGGGAGVGRFAAGGRSTRGIAA